MDRECAALLPRLCAVLADPKQSLPDDTSFEKLLDWFTGLSSADHGQALLETNPCLLEFISTVCQAKTPDPSILSFTLKLTGLLAASKDGFKLVQDRSILGVAYKCEHWMGAGLWDDPCVRIGWIQGLSNMLQHRLALLFVFQEELTQPLLQLQTDPSLFVASAANQLLAHLLIFFQSVSVDLGTAAGVEAISVHTSPVCIPVLGTDVECASVTMEIVQHLEVSLASEDQSQLLQSLRLLAVLLAQAGAPLWATLLKKVLGPLEELVVRPGVSRSTLMEVVLAASNSPIPKGSEPVYDEVHQRVDQLMRAMLSGPTHTDAIHSAGTALLKERCGMCQTTYAVAVLLRPLEMITAVPIAGKTYLSDGLSMDSRRELVELLTQKSSCVSLLCVCLSSIPQVKGPDMYYGVSDVAVILAVLSLLRICDGHAPFSSTREPISDCYGNLIGCSKVQRCGLDALASLSACTGAVVQVKKVVDVLIQYLQRPDSEPTVLKKSYQALLKWLSVCSDPSSLKDTLSQDLLPVLQKRACDVHWDVRDSTLEFLGQLHSVSVREAVLGCSTAPLLTEALSDPESYVRASAVSALAQTLPLSDHHHHGETDTEQQEDIVSKLMEILSKDTESFARRAVVQFFITWLKRSSSSSSSPLATPLCSVLSLGSADLDWEVKVHTLELAELLMEEVLPGHHESQSSTHTAQHTHPYAVTQPSPLPTQTTQHTQTDLAVGLRRLVDLGVVGALFNGLFDCDRPVALKACSLLLKLRERVCPQLPTTIDNAMATGESLATVAKVTCDPTGQGWGQEIMRKCLENERGLKDSDWLGEPGRGGSCKSNGNGGSDRSDVAGSEAGDRVGGKGVCEGSVSVCEVLWSLGLEESHVVLSQSSDHIENSPLSLLQDITIATHPSEEVIVDCY